MSRSDHNADEATASPMPVEPNNAHGRFGRRAFAGGALSVVAPIAAIARLGSFGKSNEVAVSGTPVNQGVATPAAAGSPPVTGSSTAATPVATPPSGTFPGQLEIIDNQRPQYAGAPVAGGTLRLLLPAGSNSNFSPPSFRQDFQIMASYLDPLVWIDEVTMEPRPWLAESWKTSKDGTKITFKLREDVRWHDGEPFTARDVVFSFYVYREDYDSAVRNLFITMDTANSVDEHTVVVSLKQPDGNWLLNAASQFIMQRKQYTKHWNAKPDGERTLSDFNWKKETPIGTGPWKVQKQDESEITFSRNDDYWAGPPHFETLSLTVEEDATNRLTKWVSGDADVLWPFTAADLPSLINTPGKLYVADSASVMFAAFNFNNPNRTDPALFADIQLRRALSLAIDRQRYAAQVFAGFAYPERAGTIAQPWAYDETVTNPARDVGAARKLLAEGGYADTDGDGILESPKGDKLKLRLIVRGAARPQFLAVLKSAVTDLQDIGVVLDVRELSSTRFDNEWIETHNFDLIGYAYSLYPGFTDFDLYGSAWDIRNNLQGWNPGGYANDDVDRAIRDYLEATNEPDQVDALSRLQRGANEDLFALWFGFPRDLILVKPDIQGFQPNKQWQTWDTRKLWKE